MSVSEAICRRPGCLGHKMFQALPEALCHHVLHGPGGHPEAALRPRRNAPGGRRRSRRRCDGLSALEAILSAFRPEFVVNCVGVIKQRTEAVSPIQHHHQFAPLHKLANGCSLGRTHHSFQYPDCVFSGKRGGVHRRRSLRRRGSLRKNQVSRRGGVANALTLRTSIIGRNSPNTARCWTGSWHRTRKRFADTGGLSTPG